MRESKTSPIKFAVPGGLAGQLCAIGYAAWIATKRREPVHIQFHHLGTTIGKLGVIDVLNSELAKRIGISFSEVDARWPVKETVMERLSRRSGGAVFGLPGKPASRFIGESILRVAQASTLGMYMALKDMQAGQKFRYSPAESPSLAARTLIHAPRGSTVSGYPTDYRIIEESWELLSAMIATSGYPDFTHGTGKEDSVAVHWRLGDYVQNKYHGAVSGSSLGNCLKYANTENLPVKVFTDSPEIAEHVIRNCLPYPSFGQSYQIISGDIWSDLFGMTRSKIFIGSQSGVSFLASLALRSNNPDSQTWLPDKWFLNHQAQLLFHQGPKTAGGSVFYPACLVTTPFPA